MRRRSFIPHAERHRIEAAVHAAEARTRGEFVTVITRAADDYLHVPLLYAALIALAVPVLLFLFPALRVYAYEAQLAVFIALALLLQLTAIKMRLVPARLQRLRAARSAREQFYAQRLHRTDEGTGILIFVAIAERYVAILADDGINRHVAQHDWDATVAAFVREVRAGRVAEGFVAAIGACGDRLAQHFPRRPQDRNQLPDRLIEL